MDAPTRSVDYGVGSLENEAACDQDQCQQEQWYRGEKQQVGPDQDAANHQQRNCQNQEVSLQQCHRELAGASFPRIGGGAHGVTSKYLPAIRLFLGGGVLT